MANQITPNPSVPTQIVADGLKFPKFINNLGIIPTSYKDSMSYYETLAWLCKYLEETVIPTVNQNGEAVEELQNLYIELNSYVTNYFDNLDVQNEINNKLDDLVEDGTIANILNNNLLYEINQRVLDNTININDLENTTLKNDETNIITMQMLSQEVRESMTGGSTAVVGVNSVGNENLMENSIDIINLDDKLKNTYTKEYIAIDIPKNLQGFCQVNTSTNKMVINQTSGYKYGVVDLDINTLYEVSLLNYYDMTGLIVVDSENNVILSSKDDGASNVRFNKIFRINQANLKAYISFRDANDYLINNSYLYKINLIGTNLSYKADISLVETIENTYVDKGHVTGNPYIPTFEGGTTKKYKLSKGSKYSVTSANLYAIAGFCITDSKDVVSYTSSTASAPTLTPVSYTFVAVDDGYLYTSDVPTLNITSSVKLADITSSYITGYESKSWIAVGDSLTDRSTLGDDKNYVDYVHDILKINSINRGNGGSGYHKKITSNQAFYQLINSLNDTGDIITIFGSFNDMYDENGDLINSSAIGDVDDTETTTLCGCINTTIDTIKTKFPNILIGIITPTPWQLFNYSANYDLANTYVEKIIEICKLKSIPCLDLFHESNLRPWDSAFRSTFYLNADGTHPNTSGHKRFANKISNFISSILYPNI